MTSQKTFNVLYADIHNASERISELCDSAGTLLEPVNEETLNYVIRLTSDAKREALELKRKLKKKKA